MYYRSQREVKMVLGAREYEYNSISEISERIQAIDNEVMLLDEWKLILQTEINRINDQIDDCIEEYWQLKDMLTFKVEKEPYG